MTRLAAMLSWALLLMGCSDPGPERAAESSNAGEPLRIASLSPGVSVTLIDLGLGDAIVARHGWDDVADRSLPVVGDQNGLDFEALLRAEPTHVLLQWGSRPLPERLRSLAADRGWSVESFGSLTWDELASMESRLSELAGAGAPRMRALEPSDEDRARLGALGPLLLLMPGLEPAALGPGSYHYQLASDQLGATMAGPLDGPYVLLHTEDVLALSPGVIVLMVPRGSAEPPGDPFDPEAIKRHLGRIAELDIPAVRERRVVVLDHPNALLAGSSLTEVRDVMGALLGELVGEPLGGAVMHPADESVERPPASGG